MLTPPTHLIYLGPSEVFLDSQAYDSEPPPTIKERVLKSDPVQKIKQLSVEARVDKREMFDMMTPLSW